jgi:hypothetical protein
LITFWESQGRILEDYLERQTKMQPIVTRFWEGWSLQSALKEEENNPRASCWCATVRVLETLRKLNWKVMEDPVHSPDLAPSNFQLFGLLKETLGGRRLRCVKEVKSEVISG